MNKILLSYLLILLAQNSLAQKNSSNTTVTIVPKKSVFDFYSYAKATKKDRYKIALITPLYLDSFDLAKNLVPLPKYASPGIDFYVGGLIACDALNNMNVPLDFYVYDSKSRFMNMNTLVESDKLDSMDAIIGNVSASDLNILANFAKAKKINFISAVSPADGGQTNNPFFTLLQPRLTTHVEKIYRTVNVNEANANVIFIHRDVSNEINANNYFKNAQTANGAKNKIIPKLITLEDDTISLEQLKESLDGTKENVIVCAILDPQVAYENLIQIQHLASLGYKIKVYGMPNWDNIKSLKDADEFPDLEVYFTTPQLLEKSTASMNYVQTEFKKRMGTNSTDMTLKATNAVYYYASLLAKNGVPFNEKMNDVSISFTTPLNILPTYESGKFKYWENKFLYLVKYKNGLQTYE
jgi:ABC-type branched-subunit amino acid transport system substrate-binding protein